ncbi:hypothetical protein FACS189449_09810 [Alphaproteobacteria bacterium]|nr:hypothetical protein FACS189449_09810 [Alphaproteobacteria bacterium]
MLLATTPIWDYTLSEKQLFDANKAIGESAQNVYQLIKDAISRKAFTKEDFSWFKDLLKNDPKCKEKGNMRMVLTALAGTKSGILDGSVRKPFLRALIDLARECVGNEFALELVTQAGFPPK